MRFIVKFWSGGSPTTNRNPHAVLTQNNWDDYGYKTTFHVILHISAEDSHDLGNIKMIQAKGTGVDTDMPTRPFEELPVGYAWLRSWIL